MSDLRSPFYSFYHHQIWRKLCRLFWRRMARKKVSRKRI